jgi:hypothetical protein
MPFCKQIIIIIIIITVMNINEKNEGFTNADAATACGIVH